MYFVSYPKGSRLLRCVHAWCSCKANFGLVVADLPGWEDMFFLIILKLFALCLLQMIFAKPSSIT